MSLSEFAKKFSLAPLISMLGNFFISGRILKHYTDGDVRITFDVPAFPARIYYEKSSNGIFMQKLSLGKVLTEVGFEPTPPKRLEP